MRITRDYVRHAVEVFNRVHGKTIGGTLSVHYENEGLVVEMQVGGKEKRLARNLSPAQADKLISALDTYQSVFTFQTIA